MISTNTKCLVMLGLALISGCSDGDDGEGGRGDGGVADAASGAGPDGGARVDTPAAGGSGGGAGGVAGQSGGGMAGQSGGGGAPQGGPLLRTSVPGSRQADKLTPAEVTQLCADFAASGEAVDKLLEPKTCKLAGVLAYLAADQSQAVCEETVASCLAEPAEPDEGGTCEGLTDCTATVAEVLTCLNDQITATAALLDKFPTCAQLGSGATTPEDPEALATPASCKAIEAKCPGVATPEQ